MHSLYWIFLIVFLFEKIIEIALEKINISHIKKAGSTVPVEFSEVFKEEEYLKSQSYSKAKTGFSIITGLYSSVLLIIFLYGGVLNLYNTWIMSITDSLIVQGLLFFFILSTALTILNIPFSLYSHFQLEERFGFNTMTPALWIADLFKSLLIQTIIMSILITASLAIYQASPQWWWAWLWLFYLLFTLFTLVISPYLIEPLFNKYKDLDDPDLTQDISDMMEQAGIKVAKIQVMDASRRSKHSNAYFTGIGKVKRIVFYDTLIKQMEKDEILAVLAHEAGHWKKKHILKRLITMESISLLLFYGVYRIIDSNYLNEVFKMNDPGILATVIILAFIFPLFSFFLTPLQSMRSRAQEREADDFSVKYSKDPLAMISALKKMAAENLSNLTPHPFYSRWYYSHPPILERIHYLEDKIKESL